MLPPNLVRDTADDHVKDECGVFGVFGHPEAANLTYLGLYALQHRGQEGAGIVVSKDGHLNAHRGMGLVSDVFKPHKLARLHGDVAIGHVRYSTFGSSELKNVQPLPVDYAKGSMALGHNGNLVNAKILREKLEDDGAIRVADLAGRRSEFHAFVRRLAFDSEATLDTHLAPGFSVFVQCLGG
ncbi:MAG: hypothetical protein COA73_01410 [Candidatus Hydrogenedentota bacterium]|nr:MAG: hypothetical protein COA73_01410 [Candidatus Hydrogenedentota bacterium]